MLLAIESSCDETAVSLFDIEPAHQQSGDIKLIYEAVSSQVKIHAPYGGVVPEIAAREHISNLPLMVENALREANITCENLSAVAVTRGPGLKGCLLVGLCFAKGLAYSRNIPLLALNHLEGHIFAAELVGQSAQSKFPIMSLIVSGGHTELLLIEDFRRYKLLAQTRDDAAGEAFDKIASLLKLPFPGGPALSKLAANGDAGRFKLPIALPKDENSFSFSGLKTAALRLVQSLSETEVNDCLSDICASVEEAIVQSLLLKVKMAIEKHQVAGFILTGGVAANPRLRLAIESLMKQYGVNFYVPPAKWCTDNASMIGALALRIIANNPTPYLNWKTREHPSLLGPDTPFDVGPIVRWSVELAKDSAKQYA